MIENNIKTLVLEELKLLLKSYDVLKYSLENCNKIGIKDHYTMSELTEFEGLSSRFARTSDILTQKLLKSLFIYLQEEARFFIDRCNLSEKMGLVEKADSLYNIRKLRNDITHDYVYNDISEIFKPLLEYSEQLMSIIDTVEKYITGKIV